MLRRVLPLLLATACGAVEREAPPAVTATVEVPPEERARPDDAPPPPRAAPLPPPSEDPYLYFVGDWRGLVNDKLSTELNVTEGGRFHVHLPPHPHRPACDLWGKLRVAPTVIYLDVDRSSCEAESVGTTLERIIVSKQENELVVRSADSKMLVRYTRSGK